MGKGTPGGRPALVPGPPLPSSTTAPCPTTLHVDCPLTHVTDTLQSPILLANIITRTQRERFYDRIDSSGETCWLWRSGENKGGYGSMNIGTGVTKHACAPSRLAWALAHPNMDIGPKDYICHHCDNPSCCRPEHLYRGTAATNSRDAWARRRFGHLRLKNQPEDDLEALFGPS